MPSVVSFAPDENTQDGGSRVVGFEPDEQPQVVGFEPDFSDVKAGSSSTNDTYWQGVKSRFGEAVRSPMAAIGGALDPLVKPIRESLQQGGITGSMGPDIAKQAFGRKAGGFVEGLEKDVAPGLVSGENVAITAGMLAAPQSAAFLLPKFGKEGAQQAIAATQAPEGETPEEAGRRYAQGVGGAAMALAPIIHGAAGPVREAVSRFKEPAAKLDLDAVSRESMGEVKRAPEPEVLETRIEAPAEVKPVPPREATEPTFTAIADGDKFDVSPEKPLAGTTATGSLGEAARPVVERAAEAETLGVEPTAPRVAEAGEGVAPVEGGLPLEQPDLTHRSIRDFQRAAGVPEYEREGSVVWVSPIANWHKLDLSTYRQIHDLPRNEVSDLLHMSGECLCGAFAQPGELDKLRAYPPAAEVVHQIDDLAARALAAGVPASRCVWGQRPTDRPCLEGCNL